MGLEHGGVCWCMSKLQDGVYNKMGCLCVGVHSLDVFRNRSVNFGQGFSHDVWRD